MSLFSIIFGGFLAGLIAKAITPGGGASGFFVTLSIGVAGSLVATFLGNFFGWYRAGETAGFWDAVAGGVVLLGLYRLVRRKSPG